MKYSCLSPLNIVTEIELKFVGLSVELVYVLYASNSFKLVETQILDFQAASLSL